MSRSFSLGAVREILGALLDPEFDGFDVAARPDFAARLGMVEYSDRLNQFMDVIFPAEEINVRADVFYDFRMLTVSKFERDAETREQTRNWGRILLTAGVEL